MPPPSELRSWTRSIANDKYLCSTDPKYIQHDALNTALDSEMLWWAKKMDEADLRRMVDHSLCVGLYLVNDTNHDRPDAATTSHTMVGFCRLVTDYVSFAWLTDVYILADHQGKGLATWMMQCVDEVLSSWPHLRRTMLLTGDKNAIRLYEKTLGMKEAKLDKLIMMQKLGPAGSAGH